MIEQPLEVEHVRRHVYWYRLVPGAGMLLVVALALITRWSPIVAGHPAYWVTLVIVGVLGLALVGWALRRSSFIASANTGDPPVDIHAQRVRTPVKVARFFGATLTVILLATIVWLRPFGSTDRGLQGLNDSSAVSVTETSTRIQFRPAGNPRSTGLIFYPGARVDARAYGSILHPLAEQGYLVVVLKLPFGIAFTDANGAAAVIASEPGIDRWVVGGHSLGGAVSSRFAGAGHPEVAGLLLWASYPIDSLADVANLQVASVSGTNDGLATPDKIDRSRATLPATTIFVAVTGAVHADFGDYGPQVRDGRPGIDHVEAQRQIIQASLQLMDAVDSNETSPDGGS